MEPSSLLTILAAAEKLKKNTRHCWTGDHRKESVADHSWRLALMAMLVTDEFPALDMNKVIRMCLIHDLGEAFTGDIPSFEKTADDSTREDSVFQNWIDSFPAPYAQEWTQLLQEMNARRTQEAKLYKALDNMEAVIAHNESDISTWLPLEYELQFTYGADKVSFSPYLQKLKAAIDQQTAEKIQASRESQPLPPTELP